MERVGGQKDPVIKLLRDLQTEDGRTRAGLFFAEGEELVRRAFDFGGRVDSVILTERFAGGAEVQDIAARAAGAGAPVYIATSGLLSKILDAKPTPDCLAVVERKTSPLPRLFSRDCPFLQMVERGENADNLGMLLRSTDAAGVDGVVLVQSTDPFSRRVVRGSRGAVFTVPLSISDDPAEVIRRVKESGLQVIATSAQSDVAYTEPDYTKPTMVVVGNEHVGISNAVRNMADVVVRIPMRGRINSLNIAVAASVVLYEAVRQRSPV